MTYENLFQDAQSGENPPLMKPKASSAWKELLMLLLKITVFITAVILVFTFVFGIFQNIDPSMAPSVNDGDMVMYFRWDKTYRAQDTLVLTYEGEKQVRRVVATAGDVVEITENRLIVNGATQQESNIYFSTYRYESTGVEFPLTVPEDHVFVLGDYREDATDSRVYGTVAVKDTLGKVMAILRRRQI